MTSVKIAGRKLEGLVGEMPALDAARLVIAQRLAAVETLLPMAAASSETHEESVHQLRVASRRADAAVRIFKPFFKRKVYSKVRKRLRSIRRAAGSARVCDVHMRMLRSLRERSLRGGNADTALVSHRVAALDGMIEAARHERDEAQHAIVASARKSAPAKLARLRERALGSLRSVHMDQEGESELVMTFQSYSRARIVKALAPARAKAAAVADAEDHIAALHALRIRIKRVRYAMEVFAACDADAMRQRYQRVELLQELLGDVNDLDELSRWLGAMLRRGAGKGAGSNGAALSLEEHAAMDALVGELLSQRDAQADMLVKDIAAGEWDDLWREVQFREQGSMHIETMRSARRAGAEVSQ